MCPKKDPLDEILERHGITDAAAYLDERGGEEVPAGDFNPALSSPGDVLMRGRTISRTEVQERLDALRFA